VRLAPDQAGLTASRRTLSRAGIPGHALTEELKMKYAALPLVLVAAVLTFSPASAHMEMCSDMSKMTTMMGAMPDSPKKWEMNQHLAMVNSAMAKDGTHGCRMTMMHMMHMKKGKMSMMKSGM
jgi:hypothetical protein